MTTVSLTFEDGKCTGVEITTPVRAYGTATDTSRYSVQGLRASGDLTMTDAVILEQIAARVDKMARRLTGVPQ